MVSQWTSERVEFEDAVEANEICFDRGWSDGLPIIPPTERRVRDFLEAVGMQPDDIAAEYRPFSKRVTAEKLAINAVMAGCKPEYMPIVLAMTKAIVAEQFHLTHVVGLARWPLVIVNGPIAKELGFTSNFRMFGFGSRPNATIGRAMSMIMWNCFTSQFAAAEWGQRVVGHFGRFCFCVGEDEETPWEPMHMQRGFSRTDNVVTVFPSAGFPFNGSIPEGGGNAAFEASAEQWAAALTRSFLARTLTYYVMGFGPSVYEVFTKEGWSKDDLRRYIFDHATQTVAQLKRSGRWQYFGTPDGLPPKIESGDETEIVYLFKDRDRWRDKLWQDAELDREPEILMIANERAGYGGGVEIVPSYNVGTRPVSIKIG